MTSPSTDHTRPLLSCEFFPPQDAAGQDRLQAVQAALQVLRPAFFSVTYGAGGSTRDRTLAAVLAIQRQGQVAAAPHLTCIAATQQSVRELLDIYRQHGIRRLVALRGDLPSGMCDPGELRYANELVAFIRKETGDHFHIEVAAYPECHPQSPNLERDLDHFQGKVKAGADSAITQYFYNADAYFSLLERCQKKGIDIPIVPGIMPITNYVQLARFSERCGAEIPRWLRYRLEAFGNDRESLRAFGVDVVTQLCQRLLAGGAPGLHFYTMNQSKPTLAICERLKLITK